MCVPETIAIDGPAGSGKSTIGKMLAEHLNFLYFDTGVMYRAVTLSALLNGIEILDEEEISCLARELIIDVRPPSSEDGRNCDVLVEGKDVTWEIRRPDVDAHVSVVSAYPGVREALSKQQRRIGTKGKIVMVGRDIGTVVLPDADLKIYLDAGVEERAQRRWKELQMRGKEADLDEVLASLRRRDEIDSQRALSPLRPADDACVLDTTGLSIEDTQAKVEELIERDCCA